MFDNAIAVLRNKAAHALVSKVVAQGAGLLISMLLARILDLAALGVFYIFLQMGNLFSMIVVFGMVGALQKTLAVSVTRNEDAQISNVMLYSMLNLCFMGALVAIILSFSWTGLLELFDAELLGGLFFFVYAVIILRALEIIGAAYFRGVGSMNSGIYMLDLPKQLIFLMLVGLIWMMVSSSDLVKIIEYNLAATAVGAVMVVVYMVFTMYRRGWLRFTPDARSYKIYVFLCVPMFVHGFTSVVLSSADVWIIAANLGSTQVGIYATVLKLMSLVIFALSIVNFIIPSFVASMYADGKLCELQKMLQMSASWVSVIGLLFGAVFLVWGDALLMTLFGHEFVAGYLCLVFLVIGHSVNTFVGSPGVLLQMTGHQNRLMKLSLIWALVNLLCNLLVVQRFGIEGVAFVTACTVICQNINMALVARKCVGINTYANFKLNDEIVP